MGADRRQEPEPAISVVMPVFNAERFVGEAIDSVLSQTFADFEFLVYDDGSTDGSADVVRDRARRDPRIRFFAMPHEGYVTWLNEGLRAGRGEFVARMDADDICRPTRFERQFAHLRGHPQCVVVGADYLSIDDEGEGLLVERHSTDHEQLVNHMLSGKLGAIAHPTAMMRRLTVLGVGGYRKQYETTEDLDLWLRLAEVGLLANVAEILLAYRHHEGSVCYAAPYRQRQWVDEIVNEARARRGLEPLADSIWVAPSDDAAARHARWARWALITGNTRAARKHARAAIRLDPWRLGAWTARAACGLPPWLVTAAIHRRLSRNPDQRPMPGRAPAPSAPAARPRRVDAVSEPAEHGKTLGGQ